MPRPSLEVIALNGLNWSAGAPMPQLLAGATCAVVLCYEEGDDDRVIELAFEGYESVRMGHPNDEVLHGHPLYRRGMRFYEAHLVHNSPWLEEHRRINSVHSHHSDATWSRLHHYFLAFHDEVVEVLAPAIRVRLLDGDMATELARVALEMAANA